MHTVVLQLSQVIQHEQKYILFVARFKVLKDTVQ